MNISNKKIGLALSGGGIRATIFHLGVLKWLAEKELLENIEKISSVSGASLCIGLIYAKNNGKWPTSKEYLDYVLPEIKKSILGKDIQRIAVLRLLFSPRYWFSRVNLLAKVIEKEWGVQGQLGNLHANPRWYINCTTYETGKRFRFTQENMGDYKLGYSKTSEIPIADIMAASAGFPVLIGPYKLKTINYEWTDSFFTPEDKILKTKHVHLWDGGVYDNLGIESVYNMNDGGTLKDNLEYIIVSNASAGISYKKRDGLKYFGRFMRLIDISMNQVESLRTRSILNFIKGGNGLYIKIGNTNEYIASSVDKELAIKSSDSLSKSDVEKVKYYPTTLSSPTERDFNLILTHGYQVAKSTYDAHKIDACNMKECI